MPASISLDDEPEKAETKTEPNAKTTVYSQSELGMKTWNTSGLIPQNLSDNEEIACEDQMALPAPPALIESPFENQKSVTRETLASAQTPASAETEMFEIQTPAQSNELVPPSEMTAFTNDIKTAIYNQKYETAVNAIQETNEPIQSFTMEPISRKDVEEGWKVAPKQNIQQVSHVEMQPEPLGKANPAAGSGMKRLAAPRKGNHEKTASSQKRFQIEVSEKALGEIISAGEKAPVISAAENTIEAENNEIPATVEMNQSVELPESEKTEIAENVPEKKVKQTLNIFDFGIEDMQVFKENEDFSSEKTDVDANLNDPFSSSSMCCVEEENENGEVISVSESTSTISAIYYESCKNRSSVRTISYENKDKAPAKDPKSGWKVVDNEEEEESNEPLDLDILLLPPDEFEAKSMNEMHQEAKEMVNSRPARTDFATGKEFPSAGDALNTDSLPEVPNDSMPQDSISRNSISRENSMVLPPVPSQNEEETEPALNFAGLKAEAEKTLPPENDVEPNLPNEVSEQPAPLLDQDEVLPPPAETELADEHGPELNTEPEISDEHGPELNTEPEISSNQEPELKAEEKPEPKAETTIEAKIDAEPVANKVADQVSGQIADQIADRIADQVVERTVDEVMKRMKDRLDTETEVQKTDFEEVMISRIRNQIEMNQKPQTDPSENPSETSTVAVAPNKLAPPVRAKAPQMENLEEVESLNSLSSEEEAEQKQIAAEPVAPMIQEPSATI
ncbi:MAG: hypothetical protein IJK97_03555, partial [Thermoguttaceae bacterium]|nr:hypothetical protein [Thermoguttaceae bacterium]